MSLLWTEKAPVPAGAVRRALQLLGQTVLDESGIDYGACCRNAGWRIVPGLESKRARSMNLATKLGTMMAHAACGSGLAWADLIRLSHFPSGSLATSTVEWTNELHRTCCRVGWFGSSTTVHTSTGLLVPNNLGRFLVRSILANVT